MMQLSDIAKDVDRVNISHAQLKDIEHRGLSAFYLLDLEKLRDNYIRFNKAFKAQYKNVQVAYSFKTNYAPRICSELQKLGCWAEVVSEMEYKIAKDRVNFDPRNIIVNGPLHDFDFIEAVLLDGAILNVDSWYLLDFVAQTCRRHKDKRFQIGIRLNYPITGGGPSRFGIESSRENLLRLASWEQQIENCTIEGLHSHFSNSSRCLASFASRVSGLLEASQILFEDRPPNFVNVGGGFLGEMPNELALQFEHNPDFDAYARQITSKLRQSYPDTEDVRLFLEPGTALVSNAMWFVCKVYDVKTIGGKTLAMVNGSNHNINHKWQGESLPVVLVKQSGQDSIPNGIFDVVGNTCIEKDIMRTQVVGDVEIGDYLVFQYMGAYTNVLKQPFIHPAQAIYAWNGEELLDVKRQETEADVMASYV